MMVKIEQLLWPDTDLSAWPDAPEADPLTLDDALQESQLLDVRVDAMRSRAGLLFDLKGSLDYRGDDVDVGVLIAYAVHTLSWSVDPGPKRRTAWTVMGSQPRRGHDGFSIRFGFDPHADLVLHAAAAAFVVGVSPTADLPPPDYPDDNEPTVRAGTVSWSTDFVPRASVVLAGSPS